MVSSQLTPFNIGALFNGAQEQAEHFFLAMMELKGQEPHLSARGRALLEP